MHRPAKDEILGKDCPLSGLPGLKITVKYCTEYPDWREISFGKGGSG